MPSKEYIERDTAIEQARLYYCKDCNSYNRVLCRSCGFNDAMLFIEDAPTVDVIEVVRCKDCVHRDPEDRKCEHHMSNNIFTRQDNDYCSYGERKEQQ